MNKYMNKKLIILVIILLIIITTMGIFSFLNKNKLKIIETKTFSEIPGFIFEYPVFKGWEVSLIKKINESDYQIFFSCPFETTIAPYMKIINSNVGKTEIFKILKYKENPNGVYYSYNKNSQIGDNIEFINKKYSKVNIYPFMHEGDGYSGKILVQKIIDTFKFEEIATAIKADYGKVVQYKMNQEIQLPDFTIEFKGTTETPGPNNAKWNITTYNFIITDKNGSQKIGWSSGMGEIGPQKFSIKAPPEFNVNEIFFYLELKQSIKYYPEWLKDDELVILSSKQFLEIEK